MSTLVDTGACFTSIHPQYALHLPRCGKYANTVGFLGKTQPIPMMAPVMLDVNDSSVTMPILIAENNPINLLGRDALCKLGFQIWCTLDGVYVDEMGVGHQMIVRNSCANVYWLGNLGEYVEGTVNKWRKYIQVQIPRARKPNLDNHCTLVFDETQNREMEVKWLKEVSWQNLDIVSECGTRWDTMGHKVAGQEGAAHQMIMPIMIF